MALDFTILGADGAPAGFVGIRPSAHDRLLSRARSVGLQMLLRTADYYADAEFEFNELPGLMSELRVLQSAVSNDTELEEVVRLLCSLTENAMALGTKILVLAD